MRPLSNPAVPGNFAFRSHVYATPGIGYSSVPQLAEYAIFDTPDSGFETTAVDLSAFAELGFAVPWPFDNLNVPLNGLMRVPEGRGPFPLVVFAHGNHNPFENSTPGYLYLCDLLASHGIIAVTIDVNFLNGRNFGENDGRAIIHLEHLKLFRSWNDTPGHPLSGKVDLNRIMIVGHSRGGEGVGHASAINRKRTIQPDPGSPEVLLDGSFGQGPYGFNLNVVAAIAPTDGQYLPVNGPVVVLDNYFLIHGSRDADVSTFEGYNTYTRSHNMDLSNPTHSSGRSKSLLWVYAANHNQFNSVWASEAPGPTLTRAAQEQVAKVQFGLLAAAYLLDKTEYLAAIKDHYFAASWQPPQAVLVSQYHDSSRYYLMHGQETISTPEVSLPTRGTVRSLAVNGTRDLFDLVNSRGLPGEITTRLSWNTLGARFTLELESTTVPAERYSHLVLSIGQSTEPENQLNLDQDLTLEISSGNRTASLKCSSLHRLHYPDVFSNRGKTVMQTIRVPLVELEDQGIASADIRSISVCFDQRASGTIYVGGIALSN